MRRSSKLVCTTAFIGKNGKDHCFQGQSHYGGFLTCVQDQVLNWFQWESTSLDLVFNSISLCTLANSYIQFQVRTSFGQPQMKHVLPTALEIGRYIYVNLVVVFVLFSKTFEPCLSLKLLQCGTCDHSFPQKSTSYKSTTTEICEHNYGIVCFIHKKRHQQNGSNV